MSNPVPGNLGNVITDPRLRRGIYGTFTIAAFVLGGIVVGFAQVGPQPLWLAVTVTVMQYLGAGVGLLAVANTKTARQRALVAERPGVGEDIEDTPDEDESPSDHWPVGSH